MFSGFGRSQRRSATNLDQVSAHIRIASDFCISCTSLCRVLYGRMQKHGGVGGSKSGGNPRRGMVLRFLGGCEGSEVAEFINFLILPFKSLLTGTHLHVVCTYNYDHCK